MPGGSGERRRSPGLTRGRHWYFALRAVDARRCALAALEPGHGARAGGRRAARARRPRGRGAAAARARAGGDRLAGRRRRRASRRSRSRCTTSRAGSCAASRWAPSRGAAGIGTAGMERVVSSRPACTSCGWPAVAARRTRVSCCCGEARRTGLRAPRSSQLAPDRRRLAARRCRSTACTAAPWRCSWIVAEKALSVPAAWTRARMR